MTQSISGTQRRFTSFMGVGGTVVKHVSPMIVTPNNMGGATRKSGITQPKYLNTSDNLVMDWRKSGSASGKLSGEVMLLPTGTFTLLKADTA